MVKLTRVNFTNLDKILYPDTNVTKKEVIEYYIRAAPHMLPFLRDRTTITTRYPDGIDYEGFYSKDAPQGTPDWIHTYAIYSESTKRNLDYIICNNLDTLIWLGNMASLEIHIPPSKIEANPDIMLFDIDPEPPAGFKEAVQVANTLNELLESIGLTTYVKTTGKKGLHVLLPLEPLYTYSQTREFVHQIGRYLSQELENVVSEKNQSQIPGTIYLDYLQNSSGRTMICPYSLRAEPEATVSTPVEWDELENITPKDLNIFSVLSRSDPWEGFWENKQRSQVITE